VPMSARARSPQPSAQHPKCQVHRTYSQRPELKSSGQPKSRHHQRSYLSPLLCRHQHLRENGTLHLNLPNWNLSQTSGITHHPQRSGHCRKYPSLRRHRYEEGQLRNPWLVQRVGKAKQRRQKRRRPLVALVPMLARAYLSHLTRLHPSRNRVPDDGVIVSYRYPRDTTSPSGTSHRISCRRLARLRRRRDQSPRPWRVSTVPLERRCRHPRALLWGHCILAFQSIQLRRQNLPRDCSAAKHAANVVTPVADLRNTTRRSRCATRTIVTTTRRPSATARSNQT